MRLEIPEANPLRLKATGQKRTATTGLLAPGSIIAGLHIRKYNNIRKEIKRTEDKE